MIRRTPTRLELKLDDIQVHYCIINSNMKMPFLNVDCSNCQEYEQMKREAESRRARERRANTFGASPLPSTSGMGASASTSSDGGQDAKRDTVHQRIGFDPASRKAK